MRQWILLLSGRSHSWSNLKTEGMKVEYIHLVSSRKVFISGQEMDTRTRDLRSHVPEKVRRADADTEIYLNKRVAGLKYVHVRTAEASSEGQTGALSHHDS